MNGPEALEKLKQGMTNEEVEEILGEGEIVSGHGAQIQPGLPIGVMTTQIRQWQCDDGSIVRIMFGDGKIRETVHLKKD